MHRTLFLSTALWFTACDAESEPEAHWVVVELFDEGAVCFDDNEAGELVATVRTEECLGGCMRNFQASCGVRLDGSVLTLESNISWEKDIAGISCTTECNYPETACSLADLPPGTYEVVYGARTLVLEWPLTEPCDNL